MRTQAVTSIVAAWARREDSATALERAKAETNLATRSAALEAIVRVAISRGNVEMFEEALKEITTDDLIQRCRAEAVPLIYANSGRQAVDALIESLRDVNTKEQASTQLALVLVREHRLSEAEKVIAGIQLGKVEAAITLATAVAHTGDLDNAERLARQIGEDRLRDRCLKAIARSAAELDQFDRAEYFAREIVKPEVTALTLAAIARVSYRAGGHDRGIALATAAEDLYRDHAKQRRTSRALQAMATALADIDDAHRAWRLLKAITDQVQGTCKVGNSASV